MSDIRNPEMGSRSVVGDLQTTCPKRYVSLFYVCKQLYIDVRHICIYIYICDMHMCVYSFATKDYAYMVVMSCMNQVRFTSTYQYITIQ